MSEAEPIPLTSSVTALRIPIIKKGEYDLWSMKMRQYIAITDHILWDIITNGDQATTDPASSSAPKTSLAANARRNNEKALNILLSAIPDRHLLSFHDAEDAKTLWSAIKARFGGNEASKKMQKNLLKQQFETFTIGSREELDSAYERFQNILSMLELYDAKVSHEDANLKFLRSLPSVWHVVATMIRGQPGLDELEFDDLYNNLKVYEHELKGVSNSSSQNIAFLSTEIKGSTLKQSTADPENIPKGYTQAASSKVQTAPNCASHSDEIICSFFAQQASMPTTHDDEDLLQIDEDAMEEIDIRWQVAMITARIRKFMRKTGRPIDLKPKNGITFDKSKIECFNCQKLGHFARECRFAKYQENRANGRKEKKIVAIEDSNSKALVATDNNEEIDWTKEFDAEPVTFAMMALTELEEDDWSMEIDAEPVHFGQDGLGDFDWSNKADDTPTCFNLEVTDTFRVSNTKDTSFELTAFLDLDRAGCLDTRKSTSGGIQFLGGDKLVSWSSKKQDCTSIYTVEAEYVSLSACCAQVLWLRTQPTNYGFHFDKIPMYYDSKAAIAISCNLVQHSRTKHIDVRYHFIKEQVENDIVELFFIGTEYQLADLFTKALSQDKFQYLVRRLGMRCLTLEELEVLANEYA
ncbi:retrovirus-related pol polyprotein from transposon TNT 1-94 [Tanacetum coccineum]